MQDEKNRSSGDIRYLVCNVFIWNPINQCSDWASHPVAFSSPANLGLTEEKCPDCWSGYGVKSSSDGVVTGAVGYFTVPTAKCTSNRKLEFSNFGVTLDGTNASDFSSATIYAACSGGSVSWYTLWYNGATGSSGNASWTPISGDKVTMKVIEKSGTVEFTLTDNTQHKTSTASAADTGMALDSGSCVSDMRGVYPQVNFGKIKFSSCEVIVHGKLGPVGSFGSAVTLVKFVTYNYRLSEQLNKVSGLSREKAFTITFKSSGP